MSTHSDPVISFILVSETDSAAFHDSLRSCLAQSLTQIEVVWVHCASSADTTSDTMMDPRVAPIAVPGEISRAGMRRAGLEAARSPYVLFLTPGDTLHVNAAARLHRRVEESDAQLIGYAIEAAVDGAGTLNEVPAARELVGADILRQLVPRETAVGLSPSRELFEANLLRRAYETVDVDARAAMDDRAVILHAYASAHSYASVNTVEYRRATVNPLDDGLDAALNRVGAFVAAAPSFRELSRRSTTPEPILDGYVSGRLTVVAEALAVFSALPLAERHEEQSRLWDAVDPLDAVAAAVTLAPEELATIVAHGERRELGDFPVKSVLLTTNVLTTGGVSGVLLTQARFLLSAGYQVTIATHRPGSAESLVPDGAVLVQLTGTTRRQRVTQWAQLCRRQEIDAVIDHRILYSRDWPAFALAARAAGAATIGWIHNFAGRPTYNGNDLQTLLQTHLDALAHLVVLSPLDVAFWKLRGIRHVSYLPNPPSPFLLNAGSTVARAAPRERRLELVWWGRLEEHTKKVSQLVEVAASLNRFGIDFRMRIVGPDWADMTAERLTALAAQRGVAHRVELTGPQHGEDLLDVIDSSDVFVNTSIIEGYPLTIPEAQSRGLPIAMYDLPWLSLIQDNDGVLTTRQQEPDALAAALAELAADPERYEAMSAASIAAAAGATSHDFGWLYEQLLRGALPPEHSPEPTVDDGRRILELLIFFAERSTPPPRHSVTRATAQTRPRPRRRSQPRTLGQRIERKLTPIGHRLIKLAPGLRPAAGRIKHLLLRR